MRRAHDASGTEMVTVAVRRVDLRATGPASLLSWIDTARVFLLPNTAGCYTADDAVRTARLAQEAGLSNWIKLEVIGDERTLFPGQRGARRSDAHRWSRKASSSCPTRTTIRSRAASSRTPVRRRSCRSARRLGPGLGIQNPNNLSIIKEHAGVPVIVDAGVGTASDAAIAMELGMDGVLMNTAIAGASDPVMMAGAMKRAVEAGRLAFLAGRIPRKRYASASSPVEGLVTGSPQRS